MDKIIIWGAGKAAINRYNWAVFAGYEVIFFVDNNPDMWGKKINGISICSPQTVKEYDCIILTSDMYLEDIKEQLYNMGYKGHQIGFRLFRKMALCRKSTEVDFANVNMNDQISFIFDAYFPDMNWGGTEEWSCTVANALHDLGVQTWMICGINDKFDEFTYNCLHFTEEDEISMIKKMAQKIAEHLPCVVIFRPTYVMCAARVVKAMFPTQVKIVAMAHSDALYNYQELVFWSDKIDRIICISKKMQSEFLRHGIEKEQLVYRPNPIRIPYISGERDVRNEVLRIGFAARLVKELKRAHLLPEIIEACVQRGINAEFNIAGKGQCLALLKDYVSKNCLEDRVHILGWIPPTDMAGFWAEQDIYLNISESEGMSLSMLEAMACGCVPVVTDVSGVSDVIEDGKNGFVVSVDHWLQAVDKIEFLTNERKLLHSIGNYNMKLIKDRFDVIDYAKWMIETFDDGFGSFAE